MYVQLTSTCEIKVKFIAVSKLHNILFIIQEVDHIIINVKQSAVFLSVNLSCQYMLKSVMNAQIAEAAIYDKKLSSDTDIAQ